MGQTLRLPRSSKVFTYLTIPWQQFIYYRYHRCFR